MCKYKRIALVMALLALVCWQAAYAADIDIEGTWSGKAKVSVISAEASITFSGGTFTSSAAGKSASGTYTVSGKTVTLTADGTTGKLKMSNKGDKYTLSGSHSAFGLKGTISVSKTITGSSSTNDDDSADSSSGSDAKKVLLKKGDKKIAAKEVQLRLIELWYMHGEATDYYGEQTQSAVAEFQATAGLDPTGKFDQETHDALFADGAPRSDYYNSLNDRFVSANAIIKEQGIDAYLESLKSMLTMLKAGEVPDDDDQNMLYSEALDTLVFKDAELGGMIAVIEPFIIDREAGLVNFRSALVSEGYLGEETYKIMVSPDEGKPGLYRALGVTPELFVALAHASGIEL